MYRPSLSQILLPLIIICTFSGCAKIPNDDEAVIVTVGVVGGEADIFPAREFSIPYGGGALVAVDVSRKVNTRIAGIWVGSDTVCCFGGAVIRDTTVAVAGIRGGVSVFVELAKIDTVLPEVEIVWPALAEVDNIVANISACSIGALEYSLNKRMAFGYIKWEDAGGVNAADEDSLRIVRIPEDITNVGHEVGDWTYASPMEYLGEGKQRFDLTVSPKVGKRVERYKIPVPAVYSFEIQFTDSLGNVSEMASRLVWVSGICR